MEPIFFMGMRCMVGSYNAQRKTSKIRLLNWIFKKIYGYEEKSYLPDGVAWIKVENVLWFRDKETLDKVMEVVRKTERKE